MHINLFPGPSQALVPLFTLLALFPILIVGYYMRKRNKKIKKEERIVRKFIQKSIRESERMKK